MAGVVPRKGTSGRKQWIIHEGPSSSLRRLRSQMAKEGCPESQVVLAKQLLDEQSSEKSQLDAKTTKENATIGVYWLMKASEQGSGEATAILKTCFKSGKGITELNYLDVMTCITTTQDEKLARKAAKEMFACLSNGGEHITSGQLQKRMLAIDRGGHGNLIMDYDEVGSVSESEDEEEEDWSQRGAGNRKLTEDDLVEAAVDYSHGQLPVVNRSLCLLDPDMSTVERVPHIHRSILHPYLSLRLMYYKLIKFLGEQVLQLFPLARSELQLLSLVLVYALVSSNDALLFFPLALYYVSFVSMLVLTFHMLQLNRDFQDFRLWSGLFICYSQGELNSEQAEYQYWCNNLKPYLAFFACLGANLVVYPRVSEHGIPHSELMIMSFCLTFMTLVGFMPTRRGRTVFNLSVLLSFGVNVLAKYPYDIDPVVTQGWRFLDLKIPTFATYIIGSGIDFCINFRLILYLSIPLIFARIASRDQWRGVYKVLIPHCVTLSWLQVCILSSQGATMFGLIRGSLALVGFVLFLPLVGVTSVILPCVALTKFVVTRYSNLLMATGIFIALSLSLLYLCHYCARSRFRKIAAFVQICATFISVFILVKSGMSYYHSLGSNNLYNLQSESISSSDKSDITWDIYQRFCNQQVWQQDENTALAQIKCAELDNSRIHWNGYVTSIKIRSLDNRYRAIIDRFPSLVRDWLYCYLGDLVTTGDCGNVPEELKGECELFYEAVKSSHGCTLRRYNRYTFEVKTRMNSGIWGKSPEVTLIVGNAFGNFTLGLRPGDHVWFRGRLLNMDGSILGLAEGPNVRLEEIGCFACGNERLRDVKYGRESYFDWGSLGEGLKFLVNLVLNPALNIS